MRGDLEWREICVHIYPAEHGGRWVVRTRRHRADWHWDRHIGSGDLGSSPDPDYSTLSGVLWAASLALAHAADKASRTRDDIPRASGSGSPWGDKGGGCPLCDAPIPYSPVDL